MGDAVTDRRPEHLVRSLRVDHARLIERGQGGQDAEGSLAQVSALHMPEQIVWWPCAVAGELGEAAEHCGAGAIGVEVRLSDRNFELASQLPHPGGDSLGGGLPERECMGQP